MVFIEKILLMTITQHFKKRVDLRFSCPADHLQSANSSEIPTSTIAIVCMNMI